MITSESFPLICNSFKVWKQEMIKGSKIWWLEIVYTHKLQILQSILQPCEQMNCPVKREHFCTAYLVVFLSMLPLIGMTSWSTIPHRRFHTSEESKIIKILCLKQIMSLTFLAYFQVMNCF